MGRRSETESELEIIPRLRQIFGDKFVVVKPTIKNGTKKKGSTSDGHPEAIVYKDIEHQNPLIIVECKTETNGSLKQAEKDLKVYSSALIKNENKRCPILLASTANKFKLFFVNQEGKVSPCLDSEGNEIETPDNLDTIVLPSKEIFEQLALSNDGSLSHEDLFIDGGLNQQELQRFCKTVNEKFHSAGVDEGFRATVFTSFLLATHDPDFMVKLTTPKIYNSDKVAEAVSHCVKDVIESEPKLKASEDLLKRYVDVSSAGKKALASIVEYIRSSSVNSENFINQLKASSHLLGDIYETFYTYSSGNDGGQYFTPRHAVEFVVSLTEKLRGKTISSDDVIFDNACGVGGFLISAFLKGVKNEELRGKSNKDASNQMGKNLFGCEKSENIAGIAKVNMFLRGDGSSGIGVGSSLDKDYSEKENNPARVALKGKKPTICLMNPPFPSEDSKRTKKTSNGYLSFDFIETAIDVSAEGGFIAAIVPTSVLLKEDKEHSEFRKRALSKCQLVATITLPADLFAPNASVNTCIVVLKKQEGGHKATSAVLVAQCKDDGYVMDRTTKSRKPTESTEDKTTNQKKLILNDFKNLINEWIPNINKNPNFFLSRKVSTAFLTEDDIKGGKEWTPERFLKDSFDEKEILRLAERIYAEQQAAQILIDKGGKWYV